MAYRRLRQEIQDQVLLPGAVLSQVKLAERLGVGRTPMREAMQRLEYEGILVALPQRGWMVRTTMGPADIEEMYVIRNRLETLAARRAAERCDADGASELRDLVNHQAEAFAAGRTFRKQREIDRAFHRRIWDLAESPRLAGMLSQLADAAILDPLQQKVVTDAHTLEASVQSHRKICDAIEQRDADRAELLLARHNASYWNWVIDYLSGHGT